LSPKFVEYVTTGFALLLISFMLYITFFDIKRFPLIRAMFRNGTQIEQTQPAQADQSQNGAANPAPAPAAPATH
jgi:hypothetical protein